MFEKNIIKRETLDILPNNFFSITSLSSKPFI